MALVPLGIGGAWRNTRGDRGVHGVLVSPTKGDELGGTEHGKSKAGFAS
jgi:hypothetical protein